jgi:hypothetical protein
MHVLAVRPDRDRETAIRVLSGTLVERADLVGVQGPRPGSGRNDGEFWETGPWFVKSRTSRVFRDASLAQDALERLYATKVKLDVLTPLGSIMLVTEIPDRPSYKLWTIAPRLVTLRERLDAASQKARWSDFQRMLVAFARSLGESIRSSIDAGLALDANPANFAIQGGRLRYLDDDVTPNHEVLGIEDAFVARFAEYDQAPSSVWECYAARFADEVRARLSSATLVKLRFASRLAAAATLRRRALPYVEQVLGRLDRAP